MNAGVNANHFWQEEGEKKKRKKKREGEEGKVGGVGCREAMETLCKRSHCYSAGNLYA